MTEYKRKYRFRSGNQSKENRLLWIMILIGLAIVYAIIRFF
ncbi:MAG: hypothetical protein Q8S11_06040 [Daejeonella sp.]|nr:hypothetical protein [Daejeonella sp.]